MYTMTIISKDTSSTAGFTANQLEV